MRITHAIGIIALALVLSAPMRTLAQAKTWRFAVISDMNESYGSKTYQPALDAAIAHIRASGSDFVLSTGDMVAGQKKGLDYRGMWNSFHNHVSRPLSASGLPLLPSPGNHDAATGSTFQRERDEYNRTWGEFPVDRFNGARPTQDQVTFVPGVAQNFPFNYAVTVGPAVFIALDATTPGRLINSQLDWMKEVLDRTVNYQVKVVFGHLPLYPFAFNRAHETISQGSASSGLHARIEAMLEQYKVDLYLSGHHHVFYPGRRHGHTRYVSVPLLGTGARHLLNIDGEKRDLAKQGFLYVTYDESGNVGLEAIAASTLTPISFDTLPASIAIPRNSSSICTGCGTYPSAFFLNSVQRTVFLRW